MGNGSKLSLTNAKMPKWSGKPIKQFLIYFLCVNSLVNSIRCSGKAIYSSGSYSIGSGKALTIILI
ncbi:hypothetical protein [Clostridium beijerinckii]|uniref:hypothetical protein n=1 Tax=Clostridium beijerinckii TaxID=1520 RepID=UPI0014943E69|nr:hypothetical protein [Clostridium beijerinckii]NOW07208.1 hypothetical protein [Clostridium beijerinckii]NYC05018.1 hypothetical protein [Clostridium beijerinckii]